MGEPDRPSAVADQIRKLVFDGFTVQVVNVGDGRVDLRVDLRGGSGSPADGKGDA